MGYTSCGCFGRATVNPWVVAALDFSALLALLIFPPPRSCSSVIRPAFPTSLPSLLAAAASPLLLGAALTGFAHITPLTVHGNASGTPFTVLTPDDWLGTRFPLFEYLRTDESLANGSKSLLFYQPDCPKCRDAVSYYCHVSSRPSDGRIVPIFLIDLSLEPSHKGDFADDCAACVAADLTPHQWFMQTPVLVWLNDGIVTDIRSPDEISKEITDYKRRNRR